MSQHPAVEWLHEYGRRYPSAWADFAYLQAKQPSLWPSWCWCPLAGAFAILSTTGEDERLFSSDIGPLGGLAAWRATQGIYRLHPTLLAELLETPADDVPTEVLTRLPEWCVYVELAGQLCFRDSTTKRPFDVDGFWAFLEYDVNQAEAGTPRAELRILINLTGSTALGQAVVHLGGTVAEGIRSAEMVSRRNARASGITFDRLTPDQEKAMANDVGRLVSVLLYLCADDAEIEGKLPTPPRVVQGKKRPICPAARAPVIHPSGYRIGARLDFARQLHADGELSAQGGGIGKAPHVRRAHWHRYWTGPRDGERRLALRWLSPILVGLEDAPEAATVRGVNWGTHGDT